MQYLNWARLEALDPQAFRSRRPYPWLNPEGLLTEAGFQRLCETLPDAAQFSASFGVARAHGQRPHDRYVLEYADGLEIAPTWQSFIEELESAAYHRFLKRMLGRGFFTLKMHWHYAPNGSAVSAHCDAVHKLGSHIFYFNPVGEWQREWGGETLVLDDGGRLKRSSAPEFEDFDQILAAESIGNRSLLFARSGHSWHGVREVRCPEGLMRKVFIVVINDPIRDAMRGAVKSLRGRQRAGGG